MNEKALVAAPYFGPDEFPVDAVIVTWEPGGKLGELIESNGTALASEIALNPESWDLPPNSILCLWEGEVVYLDDEGEEWECRGVCRALTTVEWRQLIRSREASR